MKKKLWCYLRMLVTYLNCIEVLICIECNVRVGDEVLFSDAQYLIPVVCIPIA